MKSPVIRLLATLVIAGGFFSLPVRAADDTQPESAGPGIEESTELAAVAGHFGRGLAKELGLTAEQRKAAKEVMRMHQPVLRPLMEQSRAEREALRALIVAPTLDETALAAQADKIAATHKQIVIASAHLRADLRKVLTADQLAKVDEMRAGAGHRAKHGRAKFQEWLLKP